MYTFYIDSVHKTTLGGGGTSLLHVLGCSVTEDTANTSFLDRLLHLCSVYELYLLWKFSDMVLQTQWSDRNNLWFLHRTSIYSLVLWIPHYTLTHSPSTSYLQRYTWYTLSKVIRPTYMRGWAREVIFPYTLGARRPSLVLGHCHYFRQNTDSTVSSPKCHLWNRQTVVILITGTDNYHL